MGGTDVWDSLLRGARARHAFVSKTIVVLGACISVHTNAGEPSTGKSTLVRHLAGSAEARATVPRESTGPLGFGYIEMSPERGSDEPLRTGVYTVHSADASVATTLPYAFPPVHTAPDASALASLRRVRDALFVITLDWREPWSFLAQLAAWLALLDALVRDAHAEGCDADAETTRVEMRTKLEQSVRTYVEPDSEPPLPDLPLSPGVLTSNLGIPLVIVCTKADEIDALAAERRVSDAQLDYIQQALRTVALRYGAAVFSTSHTRAATFDAVRDYVRARLYATSELPSVSIPPFAHRAATIDARTLLVPPGWDSWSKIRTVDERFAPEVLSDAWAAQMRGGREATELYERVVPPPIEEVRLRGHVLTQAVDAAPALEVEPEQAFLARLHAEQRDEGESHVPPPSAVATPARNALGPSMHASTLDLPAVERAMNEARPTAVPASGSAAPPTPAAPAAAASDPRTPSVTTPKQTEVLHSFFQSLLKKPSSPSTPGTPTARTSRARRVRSREASTEPPP